MFLVDDARHGAPDSGGLVRSLTGLGAGVHWYVHRAVPEGAALGRYRVEVEVWTDGECSRDDDWFFVERLEPLGWAWAGERYLVTIRNPSPEPVPARLHELDRARSPQSLCIRPLCIPALTTYCASRPS